MKRLPLSILSFFCLALAVTGQEPARLDLQLDREFYRASAENTLYLMATARTGNPLGEAVRPRLNLALVVDRSGSMEGSRLEGAKEAARAARAQLSSGDRLTLIAFGSEVDTVIPSTPIDQLVGFEAAVHALRAEGGAALFNALSQAAAQLRRHASPQSVERILLLCDGPPTRGPLETEDFARLGASLSSEGIALSAIGVGDEYPAELLYQLASGSGGALRGARDPSELGTAVQEEIGTLTTAFAKDAALEIEFADRTRVLDAIGRSAEIQGRRVLFPLNQLYPNQELVVVAQARLPAALATFSPAKVATATLRYTPLGGAVPQEVRVEVDVSARFEGSARVSFGSANREVMQAVSGLEAADTIREAFGDFEKGQAKRGLRELRRTARSIQWLKREIPELDVAEPLRTLNQAVQEIEGAGLESIERAAFTTMLYQRAHGTAGETPAAAKVEAEE